MAGQSCVYYYAIAGDDADLVDKFKWFVKKKYDNTLLPLSLSELPNHLCNDGSDDAVPSSGASCSVAGVEEPSPRFAIYLGICSDEALAFEARHSHLFIPFFMAGVLANKGSSSGSSSHETTAYGFLFRKDADNSIGSPLSLHLSCVGGERCGSLAALVWLLKCAPATRPTWTGPILKLEDAKSFLAASALAACGRSTSIEPDQQWQVFLFHGLGVPAVNLHQGKEAQEDIAQPLQTTIPEKMKEMASMGFNSFCQFRCNLLALLSSSSQPGTEDIEKLAMLGCLSHCYYSFVVDKLERTILGNRGNGALLAFFVLEAMIRFARGMGGNDHPIIQRFSKNISGTVAHVFYGMETNSTSLTKLQRFLHHWEYYKIFSSDKMNAIWMAVREEEKEDTEMEDSVLAAEEVVALEEVVAVEEVVAGEEVVAAEEAPEKDELAPSTNSKKKSKQMKKKLAKAKKQKLEELPSQNVSDPGFIRSRPSAPKGMTRQELFQDPFMSPSTPASKKGLFHPYPGTKYVLLPALEHWFLRLRTHASLLHHGVYSGITPATCA